jgi:hypothetical protein
MSKPPRSAIRRPPPQARPACPPRRPAQITPIWEPRSATQSVRACNRRDCAPSPSRGRSRTASRCRAPTRARPGFGLHSSAAPPRCAVLARSGPGWMRSGCSHAGNPRWAGGGDCPWMRRW